MVLKTEEIIKETKQEKMSETTKKRDLKIDIMKTALVLGMILSHTLDFYANRSIFVYITIKYFYLISFSGFMFVFGYNSYNAYINSEKSDVNKKLIKNILKLNLIFYISGFCFDFFALRNMDLKNYVNILFFIRLPGYSEFLATFAVLNLFMLIFKNKIKKICKKNENIIIICLISLLFTLLPAIETSIPWVNLFIKTNIASFPLLPYLNLFFIGVYFAKNNPKFKIHILFISFSMLQIYLLMDCLYLAERFPISLAYIIGSYIFIYLYYFVAEYLSKVFKNSKILNKIVLIRKKQFNTITN